MGDRSSISSSLPGRDRHLVNHFTYSVAAKPGAKHYWKRFCTARVRTMKLNKDRSSRDPSLPSDKSLGTSHYRSVLSCLKSNEGRPYSVISGLLGGLRAVELISMAYIEARASGETRFVAIDGLCRNIVEECGTGWRSGKDWGRRQHLALSSWMSEVVTTGGNPDLLHQVKMIAKSLLGDSQVADDWIPLDNQDETLLCHFDRFWPRAVQSN